MSFVPVDLGKVENQAAAATVQIHEKDEDGLGQKWTPLFKAECSFEAGLFEKVMLNLIKNPNLNSSWLVRADILFDHIGSEVSETQQQPPALQCPMAIPDFEGLTITRLLVRRMIPRNVRRDKALDQTCVFYTSSSSSDDTERSLILYLPHARSEMDVPFYHPAVRGIAFLHQWNQAEAKGSVSTHYLFFESSNCIAALPSSPEDGDSAERLTRTGLHLLRILHKHGQGEAAGYQKRVHHDVLVPQIALQTKYADLKQKYSRQLVEEWEEVTDPTKHVFEDLCIAAFLIQLWSEMYKDTEFPGFVDIGCGNGLLVHILHREGYTGWGFDARARRSWAKYSSKVSVRTIDGYHIQDSLQTLVLLPSVTRSPGHEEISDSLVHDGRFPKDTFIISNHADELTPWTPILARLSDCPFIMIPCCSHTLTGSRFRAPPPKDKAVSKSTYSSLCGWVTEIAKDCGWLVEKEILRIPSTRNTAFIGRRLADSAELDLQHLTAKYGGVAGYYENVLKLLKTSSARGH